MKKNYGGKGRLEEAHDLLKYLLRVIWRNDGGQIRVSSSEAASAHVIRGFRLIIIHRESTAISIGLPLSSQDIEVWPAQYRTSCGTTQMPLQILM